MVEERSELFVHSAKTRIRGGFGELLPVKAEGVGEFLRSGGSVEETREGERSGRCFPNELVVEGEVDGSEGELEMVGEGAESVESGVASLVAGHVHLDRRRREERIRQRDAKKR